MSVVIDKQGKENGYARKPGLGGKEDRLTLACRRRGDNETGGWTKRENLSRRALALVCPDAPSSLPVWFSFSVQWINYIRKVHNFLENTLLGRTAIIP